jgi:hypothetical protein
VAWAVAPAFAGFLTDDVSPAVPLVARAALKIAYDLALWRAFRHVRPPEEGGSAPRWGSPALGSAGRAEGDARASPATAPISSERNCGFLLDNVEAWMKAKAAGLPWERAGG